MGKKQYFDRIVIGGERPRLEKRWPEGFKQLLVDCWQEDKNLRPSFSTVVKELDALIEDEERIEVTRRNQPSHKCYRTCTWIVWLLRPLWLLLFLVLLLYALSIVIRDKNFRVGSLLCIVATFFLYGLSLSYLNVWPYVIVNKAHNTGNVITGLEMSHAAQHQHPTSPGGGGGGGVLTVEEGEGESLSSPLGAGAGNAAENSSVSSSGTYSKNSNSVSGSVVNSHKQSVDLEVGYSFNPINKVAQKRNTTGNVLV